MWLRGLAKLFDTNAALVDVRASGSPCMEMYLLAGFGNTLCHHTCIEPELDAFFAVILKFGKSIDIELLAIASTS